MSACLQNCRAVYYFANKISSLIKFSETILQQDYCLLKQRNWQAKYQLLGISPLKGQSLGFLPYWVKRGHLIALINIAIILVESVNFYFLNLENFPYSVLFLYYLLFLLFLN